MTRPPARILQYGRMPLLELDRELADTWLDVAEHGDGDTEDDDDDEKGAE